MAITISLIVVGAMFPLFMIIFGRWMFKNPPEHINYAVGYRTKRSMASQEAWNYANTTAGKYWKVLGLWCLPVFVILGAAVSAYFHISSVDESYLQYFIYGIVILGLIALLSVVPYTERKLKAKFGNSGV